MGGIHRELVYDNLKQAVRKFVGRNEKEANSYLGDKLQNLIQGKETVYKTKVQRSLEHCILVLVDISLD